MATLAVVNNVFNQDWFPLTIVSYLKAFEALAFSSTTSSLRCVRLKDIEDPPNWERDHTWRNSASQYSANFWQTISLQKEYHTVYLCMRWKDQGWGNRKGAVSIVDNNSNGGQLPDGTLLPARAPNDFKPCGPCVLDLITPAPHNMGPLRLSFSPKAGGSYSLWARAGGGGGHSLFVEDCKLVALEYLTPT